MNQKGERISLVPNTTCVNPAGIAVFGVGSVESRVRRGGGGWLGLLGCAEERKESAGWAEPGLKLDFGPIGLEKIVNLFFESCFINRKLI
jgi:hypothetical protein